MRTCFHILMHGDEDTEKHKAARVLSRIVTARQAAGFLLPPILTVYHGQRTELKWLVLLLCVSGSTGMGKVKPSHTVPPFFCAKLLSYGVLISTGLYATAKFKTSCTAAFPPRQLWRLSWVSWSLADLCFSTGARCCNAKGSPSVLESGCEICSVVFIKPSAPCGRRLTSAPPLRRATSQPDWLHVSFMAISRGRSQ